MRHFLLLILFPLLTACTSQPEGEATITPSVNLDNIQHILPTIPASEVWQQAQIADDETINLGETIYVVHCQECHGINGEGQFPDDPMKPDETGRIGAPPHNHAGHTWHHDDDLLYQIVREGGTGPIDLFYEMPAFDEILSDEAIVAVIDFIKSMWTDDQRQQQAERTLIIRGQSQ